MFEVFIVLISSILITVFSTIFRYELKSLKESNSLTDFNSLVPKIVKLLTNVHQNLPSAFIALAKLDPSCRLISPPSKSLARSFSLGGAKSLKPKLTSMHALLCSNLYLKEEAMIMCLHQWPIRQVRKSFFITNIRGLVTLVLTSIIIAPAPITLLALFYQSSMLSLLPLIASLFYGISLQLVLLVLKRYMKLLV